MSNLASRSVWNLHEFLYSRPPPHDCIITPRFPEVQSILAEELEGFEN